MTPADVEPTVFRLKLDSRPALATLLEWTAKNAPEYLTHMSYKAGVVFPVWKAGVSKERFEWYLTLPTTLYVNARRESWDES